MVDTTIAGLANEAISAANGDWLVIDTLAGTRKIQRNNLMPARGSFALIQTDAVDILNTRAILLDATDGRPREISVRDLVFGNFRNRQETQNFTLMPGIHNVRAVELGEALPNVVDTVTLNGSTGGIGGCDFLLLNFRAVNVSVVATGIVMYVDGSASNGTISPRRAATVSVNEAGTEAIFSGG